MPGLTLLRPGRRATACAPRNPWPWRPAALGVWVAVLVLAGCGGAEDPPAADTSPEATPQAASIGGGPQRVTLAVAAAAAGADVGQALLPVAATASAIERGDLGAPKAIDGNTGTRWSSAFSDTQWLQLDYGAPVAIDRVQIRWENAHAKVYELQTSNDGQQWTVLRRVEASAGGTETLGALAGQGRFLRMQGLQRATAYGYSIFEIQAFAPAAGEPPPPPPPPPPPTIDPGTGAIVLKPVAASSSGVERAEFSADKATDGNATTRWSSAFSDAQWIQFDLGSVQAIGAVKLQWENAHAAAYLLQVSHDGQTWTPVLEVNNSRGGAEAWYYLNATGRYLRVQGVKRATAYGYSLFEVTILGPQPVTPRPPSLPYAEPAAGALPVPLYASGQPLVETLQRVEADGTLVTFMGARSNERHARERGEAWTEPDKGPGRHLTFPARYFQNRTYGIEIRDTIPAGGKTIEFWLVNADHDHNGTSFSLFRNTLNPEVTDFGWMLNSGFTTGGSPNSSFCPKGQRICRLVINSNWSTNPHTPLKSGDKIELAPAPNLLQPTADGGGNRYYSNEWLYIVGQGLRPWYGIEPRLDSAPLPADTLSGGLGSVSYNYSDEAGRMFQQMFNHIGIRNAQRFVEGRRVFHSSFVTGLHSEHTDQNGVYAPALNKSGPAYNRAACIECHVNNGRSPALAQGQRPDTLSILTGMQDIPGQRRPDPVYGGNLQLSGSPEATQRRITLTRFDTETRRLPDGSQVTLQKPVIDFAGGGAVPQSFSLRTALPLIGLGLLEAVPEEAILARVDPDDRDGDGIRGIANIVFDGESALPRLGRFGWKAGKASLRQQAAQALLRDMGVTTPLFPRKSCQYTELDCRTPGPTPPDLPEAELNKLVQYLALLAVPAQRSMRTQFPAGAIPLKEHDIDPAQVQRGRTLFMQANCGGCHVPELRTGNTHPFAELRNQTIRPYTDLLLHDMGPQLADTLGESRASGRHWRTPALWGIGLTAAVQGGEDQTRYLHDGRARNLLEAILWHGGEAERSRQSFEALSAPDREALIAFLKSL